MTKANRIGERKLASNGQWMEIIEYFNNNNMTVKFEDDTIVYNKYYSAFKNGQIANPNYNPYNRVGEENIATNGQLMTIIAYRRCMDIDVQFEDGTIVTNKTYGCFKRGNIKNPNYKITTGISCNEFVIYYYLRKYGFIKAEKGSLKELGFGQMELDCYHPDYKIAIEYDGGLHETTISKDKRKNKACKQNEITIIRIREPKCPILNDNSIEYKLTSNERFSLSFETTLKEVFKYINSVTDLKINKNISFEQDKNIILKKFNKIYINKDINSRLGETNIAKNGQKMTIIAYRGRHDIDIQFEDGTIVYNKSYSNFKKSEIANPNYNPYNRIGKKRKANNGQWMEIIGYNGNNDIDVQFEDGTIVYHKAYANFKKGAIANPNYNPQKLISRIGEISIATNGQLMTIIAYREYLDIDVQFEDGTIVYHKDYQSFKKGYIKNPNFQKTA